MCNRYWYFETSLPNANGEYYKSHGTILRFQLYATCEVPQLEHAATGHLDSVQISRGVCIPILIIVKFS